MVIEMRELYWAAGFLEGEGTFTGAYQKRHGTGRVKSSATFSVNAAQNEKEPLEKLHRLFGGKIYYHTKNGKGGVINRWYLNGYKGIALMMTLWVLMSEKRRKQINVCIERFKSNATRSEAQKLRFARGDGPPRKLTDTQVQDIRQSKKSLTVLSREYGVSFSTIGKIKRMERRNIGYGY